MNKKKIMFTALTVVLLIVFGVSAFQIARYVMDGKRNSDRNQQLSQMVANAQTSTPTTEATEAAAATTEPATQPTETTQATEPQMLPGYKEVYDLNQDTVGWLKIEGTKLDNPVMQTPNDRDFYLTRDFDKNANVHGAVYAWAEGDLKKPSDNITLFGHNMKDGSMFACLNEYAKKETWEQNPLIFFDTLYEYHTYKIFAVFKTSGNTGEGFAYHEYVDAENEQDFNDFISTCKALSFYDTGITPKYGDKIICLSTCEYTLNNGRLVVAAVRIT